MIPSRAMLLRFHRAVQPRPRTLPLFPGSTTETWAIAPSQNAAATNPEAGAVVAAHAPLQF